MTYDTMATDVVILTEAALTDADVRHICDLYEPADPPVGKFHVLVARDPQPRLAVALLDAVGAADISLAFDEATGYGKPDPLTAQVDANDHLATSVSLLHTAGVQADGLVVDTPVEGLKDFVAARTGKLGAIREVVVVTWPHMVEDVFNTDWASKARTLLGLPVLHLYAGTSELG